MHTPQDLPMHSSMGVYFKLYVYGGVFETPVFPLHYIDLRHPHFSIETDEMHGVSPLHPQDYPKITTLYNSGEDKPSSSPPRDHPSYSAEVRIGCPQAPPNLGPHGPHKPPPYEAQQRDMTYDLSSPIHTHRYY